VDESTRTGHWPVSGYADFWRSIAAVQFIQVMHSSSVSGYADFWDGIEAAQLIELMHASSEYPKETDPAHQWPDH